jgi:protoheme IX farnesyltransferase
MEQALKLRQSATVLSTVSSYLQLTKPRIMLLVLFTGTASLVLEGSLLTQPVKFLLVLAGLYLAGGSANALNQYLEREIDSRMSRTRYRRPLPLGKLKPRRALIFSVAIGIAGVALFAVFFNWLTAMLALGTILFYSLFYTLWLKPNTALNIVIGGVAGAMAPVGAWTAASGSMEIVPWILFLIVFLWTPPHFWALALERQDDYRSAGLPMMPLVKGEDTTRKLIFTSTLLVVVAGIALTLFTAGWFYLSIAVGLGGTFVYKAYRLRQASTTATPLRFFGFSIVYLFGLFLGLIVDRLL